MPVHVTFNQIINFDMAYQKWCRRWQETINLRYQSWPNSSMAYSHPMHNVTHESSMLKLSWRAYENFTILSWVSYGISLHFYMRLYFIVNQLHMSCPWITLHRYYLWKLDIIIIDYEKIKKCFQLLFMTKTICSDRSCLISYLIIINRHSWLKYK